MRWSATLIPTLRESPAEAVARSHRLMLRDGRQKPYVMGCYGIGVNRIPAGVIETTADEKGIVWPPAIARYEVLVMPLDMSEEKITGAAETARDKLDELSGTQ